MQHRTDVVARVPIPVAVQVADPRAAARHQIGEVQQRQAQRLAFGEFPCSSRIWGISGGSGNTVVRKSEGHDRVVMCIT